VFGLFVVVVALRLEGGLRGGGFGAGLMTGDERKADGDGIVIVSIFRSSFEETLTMLSRALGNIPYRWM
jgi:hypothetical protein